MTQEQEAYMPTLKEEYRAMRKRMADAASAQRHFIDMFAHAPSSATRPYYPGGTEL